MTEVETLWCTGLLSVVAIIVAPITALWVQRKGDDHRALRKRREEIFRALWINRARPIYLARVDALNMIAVEFHGQRKVIDAWADLFAHYKTDYAARGSSEAEQTRLHLDKYATLVYEIGQVLGYEFGKTQIRDDIYRPELHGKFDELEIETKYVTRDLLKALNAMDALPVRWVKSPDSPGEDEPRNTVHASPDDPARG
jgi:hypothetical protein